MNPPGDAIGNLLLLAAGVVITAMGVNWSRWRNKRNASRSTTAYLLDALFTTVVRMDRDWRANATQWERAHGSLSQVQITTPKTAGVLGTPPATGAPVSSLTLEPHRDTPSPASARSGEGAASHQGFPQETPPRHVTPGSGRLAVSAAQGDNQAGTSRAASRPGPTSDDDGRRCHV
jgi:hypothetical protein